MGRDGEAGLAVDSKALVQRALTRTTAAVGAGLADWVEATGAGAALARGT